VCLLYLFFLYGVWCFSVGIIVFVCRGSCVFVVIIFLVWSLVFFHWNYFFFVWSLVFSQLLFFFCSLVVVR